MVHLFEHLHAVFSASEYQEEEGLHAVFGELTWQPLRFRLVSLGSLIRLVFQPRFLEGRRRLLQEE